MRETMTGRGTTTYGVWRNFLAAFLFVALTIPALAEGPERPPYYAIRDVRVVTGTGVILQRATVILAEGLIAAVGSDAKIPGDAWVIEGEGLTLYPGLIDAMSAVGLRSEGDAISSRPSGRPGGGPAGGDGGRPPILGPLSRPQTTPWVDAADLLAEDPNVDSWRQAGFTTALVSPGGAFFPGQAALVTFADGRPQERVVASGIAQRVDFEGQEGVRSFPNSLMGALSYVEQVLLDTRHAARAEALYRASPRGRSRPGYDRVLEPLRLALESGTPFLLPADFDYEIDRVLEMAAEHKLRPVLYGGQGAYARAEKLAQKGVPVLVNLDWPEEETGRDPDADTSFAELYHRRMAVLTPKILAQAGVPFAFFSGGLSSPDKVFDGLRQALAAGLSEEAALEALTLGAARILGVERVLGSVEAGKIANLVLASAAPWDEEVEIKAVFIDGQLYQEREKEEEESDPPSMDVGGVWALTVLTPGGTREQELKIKMSEAGKISGDLVSERGEVAVEEGRMRGDELSFQITRTMGPRTLEISYTLEVDGEALSGLAVAGGRKIEVTGERTAIASNQGSGKSDGGSDPEVTQEELERAMDLYRGPVRKLGSFAIVNAKVYTVSGETLENGTVVVEDGTISAVGEEVTVPGGIEVFDAAGGSLIPGIIDAHSHIAIDGAGNESSLVVTSMVTVDDVIDPWDIAIYRALAGGVTSVNILHGSSNPIGGGNAVIKLRWGSDADGLRFEGAPPGIKFALGENPKRSRSVGRGQQRYPATRMGVMDVIRQAFREAQDYRDAWHLFENSKDKSALPPRRDLKLERLVEVLAGERLVHSHCYRADEILQLLRLAEEFDFKIATLQHVLEGYKVADEIAAHGAGASTFSDWWGYKAEAYDAIPHNAALMTERGVLVSINSDSGEEMRHLNQEAGKMMKWGGLEEIPALALVTLNPARQLGIDHRVGSIEVGKDADLVLYDGPPLAMLSIVQKTFVDGDLYFDLEGDRQRQAAVDEIKSRLLPKDEDGVDRDEDGVDEESEAEPIAKESASPERWTDLEISCQEEGR
jgi:imidazolonepropionase-like amidohydrolase